MNTKKPIYLLGFILFIAALAAMTLTNQAAETSTNWMTNSQPSPQPVAVPAPIQAIPKTTPTPHQAPTTITFIAPVPVPTPETDWETAVSQSLGLALGLLFPTMLLLFVVSTLVAWQKQQRAAQKPLLPKYLIGQGMAALLCLFLLGCQPPAAEPLPPDDYLDHALSWLEANAVTAENVDWDAVRVEAAKLAPHPQTTADTYPAIRYAQEQLNDDLAFLHLPDQNVWEREAIGLSAIYPQNIVTKIDQGSPAEAADIQIGDEVLTINGVPPLPQDDRSRLVDFQFDPETSAPVTISLRRGGEEWQVTLEGENYENIERPTAQSFALQGKTAAYLDLPSDVGTRMYPTDGHVAIAALDQSDTCGWIIDLRRNQGGNLWTYFATLSPILGEGELGGFVYRDGSQEMWRLEDGKVFWADEEREESYVRGQRYQLKRPFPPVALLIGPLTEAAGELVVVAFQGWGDVRTFGEPSLGIPHLVLHTPLSDGALLFVSGANGIDRSGQLYNGAITPDEAVSIDWQHLGDDNDPVVSAALGWLANQPDCLP
ncbi:MAG: PDZ domain-containing protein [Anaerolineales bacterium]|nr:PDZ domain-containing protein [Anaerolineales bacterium]